MLIDTDCPIVGDLTCVVTPLYGLWICGRFSPCYPSFPWFVTWLWLSHIWTFHSDGLCFYKKNWAKLYYKYWRTCYWIICWKFSTQYQRSPCKPMMYLLPYFNMFSCLFNARSLTCSFRCHAIYNPGWKKINIFLISLVCHNLPLMSHVNMIVLSNMIVTVLQIREAK